MKAIINGQETPVKYEYPKLMVNKHGIESSIGLLLAISENEVIHLVGKFKFKHTKDFQGLNLDFTPFTGTITLSND